MLICSELIIFITVFESYFFVVDTFLYLSCPTENSLASVVRGGGPSSNHVYLPGSEVEI